MPKRARPASIFWSILEPFWELKTFKNNCKNNGFEVFSRFLQKLKKRAISKATAKFQGFDEDQEGAVTDLGAPCHIHVVTGLL